MTHLPRLDGLRGLALLMAFVNHFAPVPGAHHFGWLGVDLFFVLSGFLITGTLLHDRDEAPSRGGALGRFAARRALRIFPAYFLAVGLAIGLGEPRAAEAGPWLLSFAYNFYVLGHPMHAPVSHLWSVCVGVQFLLIWPFVALFWPRRLFVPLVVAAVALAPAWRYSAMSYAGGSAQEASFVLPGTIDCLAMGALAAWARRYWSAGRIRAFERGLLGLGALGMACWYLAANYYVPVRVGPTGFNADGAGVEWVMGNTAAALAFTGLVLRATRPSPAPGDLLLWPPLRYVGRISYGLYLYHMFVVVAWVKYHTWIVPLQIPAMYGCVAVSFLVAALSYHLFESPINSLKRYLEPKRAEAPVPLRLAA